LLVAQLGLDRHDLVVESAFVAGPFGPLLALSAERVEILAGEAPLVGDQLGADALRLQPLLAVADDVRVALDDLRAERNAARDDARSHRRGGHDLDASR